MLLELDHMTDYQSSKTYTYNVNDHKSIIIDTYPDGCITSIWLFDYNRAANDHIVAWGTYDVRKKLPNITEVIDAGTEVLNTDSLIRVADQLILKS